MTRGCDLVVPIDDLHGRILPRAAGGIYEFLGFRRREDLAEIDRSDFEIGAYRFVVGNSYDRFGSNRHNSASFVRYDGEPLIFAGTWSGHALFSRQCAEMHFMEMGYEVVFVSWGFHVESAAFITATPAYSGRVMEMDALPTGERKWRPENPARKGL